MKIFINRLLTTKDENCLSGEFYPTRIEKNLYTGSCVIIGEFTPHCDDCLKTAKALCKHYKKCEVQFCEDSSYIGGKCKAIKFISCWPINGDNPYGPQRLSFSFEVKGKS